MHLKTVKVLLFVLLLALTLASLLIGCGVSKPVYFLFTACFAGGYALVYLALWRCPFCGRRLGRSDGESCPHCGKNLLSPATAGPERILPGADSPYQGKCPEGTKGGRMLARRSRD